MLDWTICMGCLQSSVILHKQKQIKKMRGRTDHVGLACSTCLVASSEGLNLRFERIQGVLDRRAPRRLPFCFRPPHPQTCPRASLNAPPPFCCGRGEGGSGRWSPRLCLIIRPIYTQHQTLRRAVSHRSDTNPLRTPGAFISLCHVFLWSLM